MHSRMMDKPKYKPTINGTVVDLDLLYQIVTSHGGWEKVNMRNEWDDLLEHFHLPRGTNGGLVIKQIYLKYLENYEKIYFIGEDGGNKDDMEDDYDDIRNRRRTASKMISRSAAAQMPSGSNPFYQPQSVINPLSDAMRKELGLPKRVGTDYDKLILSLQSPLPNEQDMAISVCTLLCNETKHVLKLSKCPSLLTHLLAHAGVYRDCGLRESMEETYVKAREMNMAKFWEEIPIESEAKALLCEEYVKRIKSALGFEEEPVFNIINSEDSESEEEPAEVESESPLEDEFEASVPTTDSVVDSPMPTPKPDPPKPIEKQLVSTSSRKLEFQDPEQQCCPSCPCNNKVKESDREFVPPPTLARSHSSDDKVSKRVHQIALILRNLSFEDDNAEVMAGNMTMLRYLLLTANCSFGSLMQNSLDTICNVSKFIKLQDPSKDPITSIFLSSIISGLFSEDRMKIICSLDSIRNLTRNERNEKILASVMEKKVCERLCELLTLCDIMLLIYTLECIHAVSQIGESVCNEIVRVKGSVASLIALVTVEAQSYGPKGCIQMRVVETFTGGSHLPASSQSQPAIGSPVPSSSTSQVKSTVTSGVVSSMQSIGLRTVSGQTVVPPSQSQQTAFANSPSPLSGTVAAVSVAGQQQAQGNRQGTAIRIVTPGMSTPSQAFQIVHPNPSVLPKAVSPGPMLHVTTGKISSLPGSTPVTTGILTSTIGVNHQDSQGINSAVQMNSLTSVTTNNNKPISQVSSHTVSQQVFTPNFDADNLTEEAWATAWLKGGFETAGGTSIEEGELYRMYSSARKKPPASVLSQTQLVQVVRLVYGASVGPVVKSFGSTSLSFIEGIRPKIMLTQTNAVNSLPTEIPVTVSTNGVNSDGVHNNNSNALVTRPTTPVSVHGATSPLSPILKATLSRPPTPKSPVAQRQQKKLQQQDTKGSKKTKDGIVKMNGDASLDKGEESSASSSINSIDEAEIKTEPSPVSFQGVLCNGTGDSKEDDHSEMEEMLDEAAKNAKVKGMLVDLLERKVAHKDTANGIVGGREIRISDKGLELVQNQDAEIDGDGELLSEALGSAEGQEPQKMTFYASPEVVVSEPSYTIEISDSPETVLLSGGGTDPSQSSRVTKTALEGQGGSVIVAGGGGASLGDGDIGDPSFNENTEFIDSFGGGNDLLEKFNQFSDLIVVNPEQLGLGVKRPSTEHSEDSADQPPPSKKVCVNGTDDSSSSGSETSKTIPVVTSSNAVTSQTTAQVVKTVAVTVTELGLTTTTTTTTSQMVHVPVRLVNAQGATFGAGRSMVIQQGQIILSPANTQGLQGQVIISKPGGSTDSSTTKAFILIPQQGSSQAGQLLQGIPITSGTTTGILQSATNTVQMILNQLSCPRDGVPPNIVSQIPQEVLDQELPFLCEWGGCGYRFSKHQQVFMHAVTAHCPDADSPDAVRCEWGVNGCDPLLRKRFSIMTHLQDRHCNKQALELACYRRKNKIEPPPAPQQPAHHPGYAPNAAFCAIKRHAMQYMNPKDILEENEGPVTKSIRLTSALILRNLVNFSPQGRRSVAAHESQLSIIAMSSAESSRTVSQLLFDMTDAPTDF